MFTVADIASIYGRSFSFYVAKKSRFAIESSWGSTDVSWRTVTSHIMRCWFGFLLLCWDGCWWHRILCLKTNPSEAATVQRNAHGARIQEALLWENLACGCDYEHADIDADSTQPLYSLVCRQKICHATFVIGYDKFLRGMFADGMVSGIHVERPCIWNRVKHVENAKNIASLDPWPFNFVFYAPACLAQSSVNPPILSIFYLHFVCRCRVHHLDSLSNVFLPCRWQNSIYMCCCSRRIENLPSSIYFRIVRCWFA